LHLPVVHLLGGFYLVLKVCSNSTVYDLFSHTSSSTTSLVPHHMLLAVLFKRPFIAFPISRSCLVFYARSMRRSWRQLETCVPSYAFSDTSRSVTWMILCLQVSRNVLSGFGHIKESYRGSPLLKSLASHGYTDPHSVTARVGTLQSKKVGDTGGSCVCGGVQ